MKQTAMDWLFEQYFGVKWDSMPYKRPTIFEQAKEMEKEQIMRTAWHCHIEGVKQASKTSQEYIQYAEQYYNETYGDK